MAPRKQAIESDAKAIPNELARKINEPREIKISIFLFDHILIKSAEAIEMMKKEMII